MPGCRGKRVNNAVTGSSGGTRRGGGGSLRGREGQGRGRTRLALDHLLYSLQAFTVKREGSGNERRTRSKGGDDDKVDVDF